MKACLSEIKMTDSSTHFEHLSCHLHCLISHYLPHSQPQYSLSLMYSINFLLILHPFAIDSLYIFTFWQPSERISKQGSPSISSGVCLRIIYSIESVNSLNTVRRNFDRDAVGKAGLHISCSSITSVALSGCLCTVVHQTHVHVWFWINLQISTKATIKIMLRTICQIFYFLKITHT